MNKFIIALSAVVLLFASCRKDTPEQPKTTFSVLSAPKLFKVLGGSQEVTLDKAPSSAYAEDSWLSVTVNGTSLHLTAKTNEQLESRNTLLVIKNATGDSIALNVMQEGVNFGLSKTNNIIGGDEAVERAVKVTSNVPVTYATTDSWVTATLSGNILTIKTAANTTGRPRTAWVTATALGKIDSLQVTQASLKDVAGEYIQTAHTIDGNKLVETMANIKIVRVTDTKAQFIIEDMFSWDIDFTPGRGFVLTNGRTLYEDTENGKPIYYISLLAADDTNAENPTVIIGNRDPLRINITTKGELVFEQYQALSPVQTWGSYAIGKSTSKTAIDSEHFRGVVEVFAQPKLQRK